MYEVVFSMLEATGMWGVQKLFGTASTAGDYLVQNSPSSYAYAAQRSATIDLEKVTEYLLTTPKL